MMDWSESSVFQSVKGQRVHIVMHWVIKKNLAHANVIRRVAAGASLRFFKAVFWGERANELDGAKSPLKP